MSWYVKGDDPSRDSFIKNASASTVMRFWLKNGETKEIVFLDDARFGVYEHTVQLNGKWETFTCAGASCVLCGYGKDRSYAEYYSILDLTPYTSKTGQKKEFSRKALALKKEASKLIANRRESCGGNLTGKKFKVTRIGDKSPASGNDFEFMKDVDLSRVPAEMKAYDFMEALRPMPTDRLEAVLKFAGYAPGAASNGREQIGSPTTFSRNGSNTSTSTVTDDDGIPF